MVVRTDIQKLYALADKLEKLNKDIQTLSYNAVSTSENVLLRVSGYNDYPPLKVARDKAIKSTEMGKNLSAKICGRLSQQTETLRAAAVSYQKEDKISRVN